MKGKPKRDSSGRGTRENQGRGGCATTNRVGQGRNKELTTTNRNKTK